MYELTKSGPCSPSISTIPVTALVCLHKACRQVKPATRFVTEPCIKERDDRVTISSVCVRTCMSIRAYSCACHCVWVCHLCGCGCVYCMLIQSNHTLCQSLALICTYNKESIGAEIHILPLSQAPTYFPIVLAYSLEKRLKAHFSRRQMALH